jgi:hypothetical protein
MNQSEIKRETITVLEWSEPCVSLAAEAQEVLGYSRLREEQKTKDTYTELQLALSELGIEALNAADVKKYQTELLKERTAEKFQQWLLDPGSMFLGPGWEKTEIGKYHQPIPEFVINKAIQIKRRLPDILIFVEHLSDHPDPFLVVATKHPDYQYVHKEEIYVEVWEEPKFEGKIR